MGKKTKSKARLDKYYYLAKEHGFRSRAAFKLIQLNKKFHFLESATVLLDLCAAPGGWCQVASKQMPVSSIRIGIDLDPIKPIPGVKTFQADITTQRCRTLIQQEIKDIKVDVVLNDGAPNVGGQWSKDSYTQTELVLYAIKLATDFLKEGGWFITKVFRSGDYNSLIYVMRQLFGKVEATKPLASRSQAAEVFVVCSEYKAPKHIDPKLLDPKFALKQLEEEDEMKSNAVKSIKAMFDQKKQRGGYNYNTLFLKRSFKEFIECSNPYQFLFETNKIVAEDEESQQYLKVMKSPVEYKLYFEDIKLLGKKEIQELIIWRNKIRAKSHVKPQKEEGKEEEGEEKEEIKEHNINDEIDDELEKFQKQRKKRQEQERKKKEKQELKNKQQYIEQEEQVQVDNDVEFDQEVFDYIQKNKIDIEKIDENIQEEKEENQEEGKFEEFDLDELSEDDYIDMMNEDIEENKRLFEEEKGTSVRKKKKKKEKEKDGITYVEQENMSEMEEEDLKDSDLSDEDEEGDNSSDYEDEDDEEINIDEDKEESADEEDEDGIGKVEFSNPLRKEKKEKKKDEKDIEKEETKNEEDNPSSDTDEEKEDKKKQKNKKKETESLLNKKTKRTEDKKEEKDEKEDKEDSSSSEDDGYDTDEKAEIRAIAKKMLRKKERINILNKTYNRYAFDEEDRAPKWFIEEEKLHNVPAKPVTKAEILAERSYLKKINDRMPKKILEAKARKKFKLNKRLEKVKKKAEAISNQEEINEFSKLKQIEKLYKKELSKGKEKKKYIISRAFTGNNRGKDGRNVKHVDRRLKKDKRAEKAREKRMKKFKRRER